MIYTNIILTLIFLLLLSFFIGAIYVVKKIIEKLKSMNLPLGAPNSMMNNVNLQEIYSNIFKNMGK